MLDIITQTNRTMLFEEINPQKLDLIAMVGETKGVDSLSDDKIKEIDEALAVHSLEEFLDKFQPVVYSFFNAETQTVLYTLKKPESIPESLITEIPLNLQNDFLNMLISLVNIKRAQGIANVDFKFEKITDMISPRKVMDDILQSRKEIHYVYGKYELLEEGDPAKLDLADRLNVLFEEASENYNNVMAMLPLALEDIKTRLLLGAGGNLDDAKPLRIGKLSMGDKGELKVIEAPKEETKALALSEGVDEKGLALTFAEDYEAVNEEPTDYIKSLVVRTFCPLMATAGTELDVATEVANYNSYLDFYRRAKDDFIKAVKPLIEKVLGVKMFFDQYDVKNRSMVPTMLVTNCKPEMLSKSMNLPCLEI